MLILSDAASYALRNAGVQERIAAHTLTIKQALELSDAASRALRAKGYRQFCSQTPRNPLSFFTPDTRHTTVPDDLSVHRHDSTVGLK